MEESTREAFFALLRAGLWEKEALLSKYGDINIQEVYRLSEEQSVWGVVAAGMEHVTDVRLPKKEVLQFVGQTLQLEQQNRAMNDYLTKLIEKLHQQGIYTLLVKGQGVAQSYERPLWRSCGDIDLFLSDENYKKAKDLLSPMASSIETEYEGIKHLGLTINGWVVELHGSLRVGLTQRINKTLDEIQYDTFNLGNVRFWDNNGVHIFMLGIENDIFYVFVHYLNHFYKGGIGLRQVCDWCRLLWTYRNSLDNNKLELCIRKSGLLSEWKAFGAFSVDYLGMPIEAMPLYSNDIKWKRKAERIKAFIIMSGNFGHNRDMSYYDKYPYLLRKIYSMRMRIGDLINHASIFPLDSLRFFPSIMMNGVRAAVNGEG